VNYEIAYIAASCFLKQGPRGHDPLYSPDPW
jgi:hypothetical protein